MNKNNTPIPYLEVQDKIATIRKQPVMADADVAELYGVETREVNQAVRNNPDKFPEDYMFALSDSELKDLRSKILITNVSVKSRSTTKVFTEKGLYMLATILKSEKATAATFAIIETFAKVQEVRFAQGKRQRCADKEDAALWRGADRHSDARPRDLRDGILVGNQLPYR